MNSIGSEFRREAGRIVRRLRFTEDEHASSIADLADAGLDAAGAWWQSVLRGGRPAPPPLRSELRIVDLFSGAGGLALGAAMAAEALGRLPRFAGAVDLDRSALAVHQRNLGTEVALAASVRDIVHVSIAASGDDARFAETPELLEQALARASKPHLVIGGPPCEGHSNLNNRSRRDDPRNTLLLPAVAVAVAACAEAFVFENVRHLARDRRGTLPTAVAALRAAGWAVETAVLDAADFGAPQRRERMFLIGFSGTPDRAAFRAVLESFKRPPLPISAAIGDLFDRAADDQFDAAPTPTEANRQRIEYLFRHDLHDLPNEVRPDCHRNGTSYTSVYGRLWWDRPAPTITTGFGTPGRGRFVHPLRPRLITPHEAARLQTFPDWFEFLDESGRRPPRKHLEKWIGDAVPPLLGCVVVLATLAAMGHRRMRRAPVPETTVVEQIVAS